MTTRQFKRRVAQSMLMFSGAIGIFIACGSCTPTLIANQTEELDGNITVSFINDTRFRASFSFGTWNSLDRSTPTPGPIALQQLRLESQQTSAPTTLVCRRNFAIGTQELVQRASDTRSTTGANFDPDAFSAVVNFSSAPATSSSAALPSRWTPTSSTTHP